MMRLQQRVTSNSAERKHEVMLGLSGAKPNGGSLWLSKGIRFELNHRVV